MKFFRLRALIYLLACGLSFTSLARAETLNSVSCEQKIQPLPPKKKKWVKSLTGELWKLIDQHVSEYPAPLRVRGIVVGDFHFGNLGVYFDPEQDRAELTLNDLDDSGVNFLTGDLLKYLVYLRTLNKDMNFSQVIDAYVMGLQNETISAPKELRQILSSSADKFTKKQEKYILKMKRKALAFNPSGLTAEQKNVFETLENLPEMQNAFTPLHKWLQVNDSGSSAGLERYLFWGRSQDSNSESVIEFKTLKCSATGNLRRQNLKATEEKVVHYIQSLSSTLGPNHFFDRQSVVVAKGKFRLMREKQVNLMNDLDLEKLPLQDMQVYAEFYANYLGRFHSAESNTRFVSSMRENKSFLVEDLKPLWQEFKEQAESSTSID